MLLIICGNYNFIHDILFFNDKTFVKLFKGKGHAGQKLYFTHTFKCPYVFIYISRSVSGQCHTF